MYADLERKECTKCGDKKNLSEFYKYKPAKDGRDSWCKVCKKEYVKRYQAGPYKDTKNRQNTNYRAENPEKTREVIRMWAKKNAAACREKIRKYQAKKFGSIPNWLTKEHREQMKYIYATCPKGYEVDHIVPLQGKNVTGLHVPWNLQILPAELNRSKGNKF
jgi:hypothetical protein